jgi:hypothetical protein
MDELEKIQILEDAIRTFGQQAQMIVAMEEAAEMIHAIAKCLRKNDKANSTCLASEIADVEIMIEQVKLMHSSYEMDKRVEQIKPVKYALLRRKLLDHHESKGRYPKGLQTPEMSECSFCGKLTMLKPEEMYNHRDWIRCTIKGHLYIACKDHHNNIQDLINEEYEDVNLGKTHGNA